MADRQAPEMNGNESLAVVALNDIDRRASDRVDTHEPCAEGSDNREDRASEVNRTLQLFLLTASLFCGIFVMALDATIIGTAVPSITAEFKSLDDVAWYGSGYLLTITSFQPTYGKLYKTMNIKVVFMACVSIFEVGSILCATAPSSAVFILGRCVAGAGAAGLFQGALAIITRAVRLSRRPIYISIITSTYAVSICIGPVIGGLFTQYTTWRWCFWINVPIGLSVLIVIFITLRVPRGSQEVEFTSMTFPQKLRKLDPIGALLIISAMICILLALEWGGQDKSWNSATVIGLLVAFPLLLGLFGLTQWVQGADAAFPWWFLNQRSMLAVVLFNIFYSMATYIYGYYLPIYFQAGKGFTATQSGIWVLALAMPQTVTVVLTGFLVTRTGLYVPFMVVGTAIGIIGSGLILSFDSKAPPALEAIYLIIYATGSGLAINLPYTAVQATLAEKDVPTGNAAIQFAFQFGSSISIPIGHTIFLNQLKRSAQTLTPSISYSAIVQAGPYELRALAESEKLYNLLRQVYMSALHDTYILPIVTSGVALLISLSIKNKNLKNIEKERKQANHLGQPVNA